MPLMTAHGKRVDRVVEAVGERTRLHRKLRMLTDAGWTTQGRDSVVLILRQDPEVSVSVTSLSSGRMFVIAEPGDVRFQIAEPEEAIEFVGELRDRLCLTTGA